MQSSALISGGHSYSEVDISMSTSMTLNLCFLVSVWARVSSSKNILCLFPFNNSKCLPMLSHNCMPFFFNFSIIFFILNPTLPLGQLFCCISCSPVVLASKKSIIFILHEVIWQHYKCTEIYSQSDNLCFLFAIIFLPSA